MLYRARQLAERIGTMATEHDKMIEAVKMAVAEVLKAERDEFWVAQPQHYLDHQMIAQCKARQEEWRLNHEFISSVRSGAAVGRKAGIVLAVTAGLSFIGGAVWLMIKTTLSLSK